MIVHRGIQLVAYKIHSHRSFIMWLQSLLHKISITSTTKEPKKTQNLAKGPYIHEGINKLLPNSCHLIKMYNLEYAKKVHYCVLHNKT